MATALIECPDGRAKRRLGNILLWLGRWPFQQLWWAAILTKGVIFTGSGWSSGSSSSSSSTDSSSQQQQQQQQKQQQQQQQQRQSSPKGANSL
jgi:hypothetical protein